MTMIDAGLVVAIIVALLMLLGLLGSLVWAVVWLVVKPVKEDVADIKASMRKVKSEDELKLMITKEIGKHEDKCRQFRQTETGTFRAVGTRPAVEDGR